MNSDKLQRIFKEIEDLNPPEGLETLILKKIELEKEKQVRGKLFLSYFGLAGSLAAAMYAIVIFGDGFLKSEFWSMASLIFSDVFIVAGNWQEYAYSLLETFPVTHLIAILIPVFGLLLSFNLYLSLIKKAKHRSFNLILFN
ncbi:MAG: hypothetical protein Q7S18_03255 [bacterium]|nr:hypothetical protein [bacterium]